MAITGDLVSGQIYDGSKEQANFWEHYFEEFFHIMNSYNIPWGFVPGYHDYESGLSTEEMERIIMKSMFHTEVKNNFKFLGKPLSHGFNFNVPIETNDSS